MNAKITFILFFITYTSLFAGCASLSETQQQTVEAPKPDLMQIHMEQLADRDGVEIFYNKNMTTLRLYDGDKTPSVKEIVSLKESNPDTYTAYEMHINLNDTYTEIILVPLK